ncbi:MAG: COG4223 family protein [Geminicoccaceae bacterium]
MARNRGKRPGTASGSTSPNQGQTKDKETKTSTAGTTSSAATTATATGNPSVTTKADMPTTTGKTVASTDKTASSAAKSASGETTKPSVSSTTPASSSTRAASSSSAAAGKRTAAAPATQTAGAQGGGRSSENGGFWPGLIGGVIGGAATALAASLFWAGGDDGVTTALESRLAAAEQQVGEVAGLTERVTAIEVAPSAGGDDLAARLGSLEEQLAALGDLSSDANGGLEEQLASLQQQVEALAGDLGTAGDAQQATAETVATLETTLADTGSSAAQTAEQTTALGQSVETLNGDVQSLATRVGEAEGRLDHLGGEYQRGAAMIVALGDVDRAITRAEPFASALESLKLLMRDEAALGETVTLLEPVAAEGVPSLTDLKDAFASMASRALLAEGGNQSLTDQVSNNVFGIINMRPSGADADGTSSRDMLSRAQARLSGDDLEGAIGELAGLDGSAAEEAKGWVEQAQARLSAEAAVVELRAHAQALVAEGS